MIEKECAGDELDGDSRDNTQLQLQLQDSAIPHMMEVACQIDAGPEEMFNFYRLKALFIFSP
jgi:hypothetical protein